MFLIGYIMMCEGFLQTTTYVHDEYNHHMSMTSAIRLVYCHPYTFSLVV